MKPYAAPSDTSDPLGASSLTARSVAVVNDVTVRYDGVTVVGSDSDLVARSFAYFDTRPLAQSISGHPSSTTEDRT